jgi:hypothetical protein
MDKAAQLTDSGSSSGNLVCRVSTTRLKILKNEYTEVTIRNATKGRISLIADTELQLTYYVKINCSHFVKIDSHTNESLRPCDHWDRHAWLPMVLKPGVS